MPRANKPDEGALRRPGFQGGTPVVLADGQTWYVPDPVVTPVPDGYRFARGADGVTRLRAARATPGDEDYGALLDRYVEGERYEDQVVALADLAYHLLARNYDLAFEDTREIFARYFDPDPRADDNQAAWDAIAEVALGTAPKLSAGGSAPP